MDINSAKKNQYKETTQTPKIKILKYSHPSYKREFVENTNGHP